MESTTLQGLQGLHIEEIDLFQMYHYVIMTPPQFGPYSRYSSDGTKLEGLEDPSLNG